MCVYQILVWAPHSYKHESERHIRRKLRLQGCVTPGKLRKRSKSGPTTQMAAVEQSLVGRSENPLRTSRNSSGNVMSNGAQHRAVDGSWTSSPKDGKKKTTAKGRMDVVSSKIAPRRLVKTSQQDRELALLRVREEGEPSREPPWLEGVLLAQQQSSTG